jgi:hypothetical protein
MASPLTSRTSLDFSVIVRKCIEGISNYFWVLNSSSFIRKNGICSVRCNFPVSCFIIFQVVFI